MSRGAGSRREARRTEHGQYCRDLETAGSPTFRSWAVAIVSCSACPSSSAAGRRSRLPREGSRSVVVTTVALPSRQAAGVAASTTAYPPTCGTLWARGCGTAPHLGDVSAAIRGRGVLRAISTIAAAADRWEIAQDDCRGQVLLADAAAAGRTRRQWISMRHRGLGLVIDRLQRADRDRVSLTRSRAPACTLTLRCRRTAARLCEHSLPSSRRARRRRGRRRCLRFLNTFPVIK